MWSFNQMLHPKFKVGMNGRLNQAVQEVGDLLLQEVLQGGSLQLSKVQIIRLKL